MVERVGHLAAISLALKIIIADFRGGIDGILYITLLYRLEHLIIQSGPYSGIEIGLQLETDTDTVGLRFA